MKSFKEYLKETEEGVSVEESGENRHHFIRHNIWTVMDSDEEVLQHSVEGDPFFSAKKFIRDLDDQGYEFTHVVSPEGKITYLPQHDPRHLKNFPDDQLDEFDIDTLNQLASHPMAGTLAAAGGAAIGATIGKGITKAADWYKNRQEKKAWDNPNFPKTNEGAGQGIMVNGKEVDMTSLEVDGVDSRDYPDFADAYFSAGYFVDGTEMSDEELDQFQQDNGDLLYDKAYDSLHESELSLIKDRAGVNKSDVPAYKRKNSGDPDWKVSHDDLKKEREQNASGSEGLAALKKRMGMIEDGTE
jgi:hypothetical protein